VYVDLLSHRPSPVRRRVRAALARSRATWRGAQPVVLAGLAASVLVCGTVGYTRTHISVLDSLYGSIQLFAFAGNAAVNPNPWLQVARFAAPVVVGYAAVTAIVALYREKFDLLRFRRRRNHVVVAGAGTAGFATAAAFDREEWRVIVVDKDASNAAIRGCRERGIGVIVGDATDPRILRNAGVEHAILVVAMCGSDGANLDVAAAARGIARERRRGVLTVLAEIDDLPLWQTLRAQALIDRDEAAFRLELFNNYAVAAEMLLDEHPPFAASDPASHVLVVGSDSVAVSLVLDIVQRWLGSGPGPGAHLRVTIGAPEATGTLARLVGSYPEIDAVPGCEVAAWDVELAGQHPALPNRFTAIYISSPSDTEALTTALTLRDHPDLDPEVPIVIAVEHDEAGVGAAVARGGYHRVSAFGVFSKCLTPQALLYTTTERIAEISHHLHRQDQLAKTGDASDPSLAPWRELPEALRESNRLFADGIGSKLAELGATVTPAPLIDPRGPLLELSAHEIEHLAPGEHQRWEMHMKRLGYRHGDTRDHERKRHPMIDVPYEDLPEENKEKDRAHVRTIPAILAHAGLSMHRPLSDQGEGTGPAEEVGVGEPQASGR
jgi:hypothetical protein